MTQKTFISLLSLTLLISGCSLLPEKKIQINSTPIEIEIMQPDFSTTPVANLNALALCSNSDVTPILPINVPAPILLMLDMASRLMLPLA